MLHMNEPYQVAYLAGAARESDGIGSKDDDRYSVKLIGGAQYTVPTQLTTVERNRNQDQILSNALPSKLVPNVPQIIAYPLLPFLLCPTKWSRSAVRSGRKLSFDARKARWSRRPCNR